MSTETLGRCKDCRWRKRVSKIYLSYAGHWTCDNPRTLSGYGPDAPPENGILVEDDEGWAILVGPEFGCVNFKQLLEPDGRPRKREVE